MSAEERAAALAELAAYALPEEAPGAWIRAAIQREIAALRAGSAE